MKLKRKTKFWLVVSAILGLIAGLLVLWGVRGIQRWRWHHAGPIENHPVRIWDVNFAKEFNDLNEAQLAVAQAVGVPPVEDRAAAEHMTKRLVEIVDNDLYCVDELTHSIPFLVPSAAELLDRIGRNFHSTHRYGTTFDISYWHYVKVPDLRERPYADVPPEYLRATLSQVLKDLHDEGACYVKYEKKQTCFHITVRK